MRTPLAIKCREINSQKNPPQQPCTAFCVRRNVGRRCWQHEQLPFDARAREKLALEKNVTDRKARWHLSNKRVKKHIAARLSWVGNFLFPAARLIFRLGILSGCGQGIFLPAKPAKFKFAAARAVAAQRCLYISGDKIILYTACWRRSLPAAE